MMKRFLLFGITDYSDITAGARGYIGSFGKTEELVELLKSKIEWLQEHYIDGFNILDSKDEEIIRDDDGCSYWCFRDCLLGGLNNNELDSVMEVIEEKVKD
ncbi:MAG: hypothetical protein ACRCVJ_16510 [Clostridium sp.]|uniref:hypothetical protein n=1 Tax=Clostridium sp. TaxID=1506 RepID=UPI003F32D498